MFIKINKSIINVETFPTTTNKLVAMVFSEIVIFASQLYGRHLFNMLFGKTVPHTVIEIIKKWIETG